MAVTQNSLTTAGSATDASSYNTASITPTGSRLVLAAVVSQLFGTTPAAPSLSGNGLTWAQVNTITETSNNARLSVFRSMGASPSSGAITIDFSGTTQHACAWSIMEFDGIDTSGTNGSGAIVQSTTGTTGGSTATSLTVTLSAFGSTDNATYGAFYNYDGFSQNVSPGTGFTEIHETTAATNFGSPVKVYTEWRNDNDTSVDASVPSFSIMWRGIAVEIKAAAAAGGTTDHNLTLLGVGN